MWLFRYRRDKTLGTYNFGQYQIYVSRLARLNGKVARGITVQNSDSVMEIPFILTGDQASALLGYLEAVAASDVPKRYCLKGGFYNFFTWLDFIFSKYGKNAVEGRISMGGRIVGVTVSLASLQACAQALKSLYEDSDIRNQDKCQASAANAGVSSRNIIKADVSEGLKFTAFGIFYPFFTSPKIPIEALCHLQLC